MLKKNQIKQHDNKYHTYIIEEDNKVIIHVESLENNKWICLGEYEIATLIRKSNLKEVKLEDCSSSSTILWYGLKGNGYDK